MKQLAAIAKLITWPMVAVLGIGAATFVAIALFAEGETRTMLLGANGLVASLVSYWLQSPRERANSLRPPPPSTPPGKRDGSATAEAMATAAFVCCFVLALFAAVAIGGCGASAATHGAYAVEQARCIANERGIISREGSTREADLEAMDAERARCDEALRAIEEGGE